MAPRAQPTQRASIAMAPDEVDRFLRALVRERVAKRLAVRIEVERVVSWDHRKLVRGDRVRDR